MQGMALDTAIDSNVLSYLVLIFMTEQGAVVGRGLPSDVGRGGACPQTSGGAEPALSHRARRSQPSEVRRGGTDLPLFGQEA